MKLFVWVSSLDLQYHYGSTPGWWQLLKALSEIGVELIVSPYQGKPIESLWWSAGSNPCQREGNIYYQINELVNHLKLSYGHGSNKNNKLSESFIRRIVQAYTRPKWEKYLKTVVCQQTDIDAVLILSVPANHITGIPSQIRKKINIPIIYYDGDVPASLPSSRGFVSGFRIYQGVDLSEYDLVISNSKGGSEELGRLGAKKVEVLYYGVDPMVFSPLIVNKDIDVFFYGHGREYREKWIEVMLHQPSNIMRNMSFCVRGSNLGTKESRIKVLPYGSFSKLKQYISCSKINLIINRDAHSSVYASSTSRPFELASMGCLMVSSPYLGIEEWFTPDEEVILINENTNIPELYANLLNDSETQRTFGERARSRVLSEHTFHHRAVTLVSYINSIA